MVSLMILNSDNDAENAGGNLMTKVVLSAALVCGWREPLPLLDALKDAGQPTTGPNYPDTPRTAAHVHVHTVKQPGSVARARLKLLM